MNNVEDWLNGFYELNPSASIDEETNGAKKSEVPLKLELSSMDRKARDFYKTLTDEQRKAVSLWVLMRYMSSSKNMAEYHLLLVNEKVNVDFNIISKHPELQWLLLTMCGTRTDQFHTWIPPGKKAKKNKLEEALSVLNPLMKRDELELLQKINSTEELMEYFKENAYDDKTIKELFKKDSKGK